MELCISVYCILFWHENLLLVFPGQRVACIKIHASHHLFRMVNVTHASVLYLMWVTSWLPHVNVMCVWLCMWIISCFSHNVMHDGILTVILLFRFLWNSGILYAYAFIICYYDNFCYPWGQSSGRNVWSVLNIWFPSNDLNERDECV